MTSGHLLFCAQITYASGLLFTLVNRTGNLVFLAMAMGVVFNGLALGLRYWQAWPMMPMYLGLPAILCCLAVIWLTGGYHRISGHVRTEGLMLQVMIVLLGLTTLLFPKDFYLPFLRSVTIWSHIFLITGVLAKGFLLFASIKALVFLVCRDENETGTQQTLASAMPWALWGFVCLTLSMFSGEVWSYLGWGTPVVWHDPAITTVMAIWFYWIALLHLHYTGTWDRVQRAIFMMVGGLLVIIFACHPDMGPFRLPFK